MLNIDDLTAPQAQAKSTDLYHDDINDDIVDDEWVKARLTELAASAIEWLGCPGLAHHEERYAFDRASRFNPHPASRPEALPFRAGHQADPHHSHN